MRIRSLPNWLRLALALLLFLAIAYPLVMKNSMGRPSTTARGTSVWPPPSIKVAVPWPADESAGLVDGVTLALEDLDAGGGPLAGRVRVSFFNEPEGLANDGALARRIAADRDVVAVIGHESSAAAVQAAVTYERAGILHLSPKATLSRLTYHRFQYTFRLVPNDDAVAASLVELARTRGWKHIGILYARIEESEALAQAFSLQALREGLVPGFTRSYLPARNFEENDFRPLLASALNRNPVDAILLADRLPWAGKMLIDMQALGMKQPVLAGHNLDSSATWRIAGTSSGRLLLASFVDPESKEPAYTAFRERFRKRFGTAPGYGASQGYEAFTLFAKAVERSRSTTPIVVATTLRTNTWDGLFGVVSFTMDGQVEGRKVIIKRIENGLSIPVKEVNQ